MLDYNTLVLYACYNDKVMLHEKRGVFGDDGRALHPESLNLNSYVYHL